MGEGQKGDRSHPIAGGSLGDRLEAREAVEAGPRVNEVPYVAEYGGEDGDHDPPDCPDEEGERVVQRVS